MRKLDYMLETLVMRWLLAEKRPCDGSAVKMSTLIPKKLRGYVGTKQSAGKSISPYGEGQLPSETTRQAPRLLSYSKKDGDIVQINVG